MDIVCIDCKTAKPRDEFRYGKTLGKGPIERIGKRCFHCRTSFTKERKERDAAGLKKCGHCKLVKPKSEFTNRWRGDLDHRCHQCASDEQNRRRRAKGKKELRRRSSIGSEESGFICCICKTLKPSSEYRKKPDGYWDYRCMECARKRTVRDWNKHRFQRSIAVAKRRGLAWDLTPEQFAELNAKPCHYCGFPLPASGVGLDRLNSLIHYTFSNVVPCCSECNLCKGSFFSVEEMLVLGKTIASIKQARILTGVPENCMNMG